MTELYFKQQLATEPTKKRPKHGGLDLSRRGLDQESRSRHWQRVSLDSPENLNTFKKLVLTVETP